MRISDWSSDVCSSDLEVGGTKFLAQVVDGLDPKGLRGAVDEMKKQVGSGVAMLVAVNDGRASVAVGVTDDATGSRNAVDLRSEEHTSELQSLMRISYAVFCLKKKTR